MIYHHKISRNLLTLSIIVMCLVACMPVVPPQTDVKVSPQSPNELTSQLMKREAPNCNYGGKFKAIEAIDEFSVKFTLCSPDGAFLSKLASIALSIQSAKHLQETSGRPLDSVLGTGPYKVKEWNKGEWLILESNPNYWSALPKTPTLTFTWNPEAGARLLSLQAQTVDGIDNPDPDNYNMIKSDPNLKLYLRPSFNIFYIGLPNTKPPLDNDKVRQALAMGIDRKRIVDTFFPLGSTVADYLAPCEVPGGCVGTSWPVYNPEEAKKLLAEAGFPNGFKIKLQYRDVTRAYLPSPGTVAVDIQSQLSKIGVQATIEVQESGTFVANSIAGNLEMHLLGTGGSYPDQTSFVDIFFGKNADQSFGHHWPDLEDVIAKAATVSDLSERIELYAKVNDLIVQHAPFIPVAHSSSALAFTKSVEKVFASPIAIEKFTEMYIPGKDNLRFAQNLEPDNLYCADDSSRDTLRICAQMFDSLFSYKADGTGVEPSLAEECTVSADNLTWICVLRQGVKFSDGTPLTANDVVATYVAQWDAADPLHTGSSGTFYDWSVNFGPFLNSPPK